VNAHEERLPLNRGQNQSARLVWFTAVDMGYPMKPPGDNAHHGDVALQAFSRLQATILHGAAGLKDFVKNLDLPSATVPLDNLKSIFGRFDRCIGEQQPFDGCDIGRRVVLTHQDSVQCNDRQFLALGAPRRPQGDSSKPDSDGRRAFFLLILLGDQQDLGLSHRLVLNLAP
jgi:hypothetical protein